MHSKHLKDLIRLIIMDSKTQRVISRSPQYAVFGRKTVPYLVSLGVVSGFAAIQWMLWSFIQPAPFLFFYPAVILCALIGDGILGIALSCIVIQTVFVNGFQVTWPHDIVRMSIFLISSVVLTSLIKMLKDVKLQLEHQKDFFSKALSATADFVYVFDRDGKFIFVNQSLLSFWNQSMEEVRGKEFKDLGYPADLVELHKQQLNQVLRTRQPVRGENYLTCSSGENRYFEYVFSPAFSNQAEPEFIVGITRDITDRKQTEVKLHEAVEARKEVLAIVSHDLRNPLGAILMNISLYRKKTFSINSMTSSLLGTIERAAERMNQMIEDLLSLARIEAGTFSLLKKEVCGCDIISEALETSKPLADEKHIRIETKGLDQSFEMACDHAQILRVFSNLIGNAIKFTPEYGLIEVEAVKREDDVLFKVSDTGPGIAAHHLPHIFDRFWQAKKSTGVGAGLGLMISKGIVEAHGGKIWAESEFGHGATFHFLIPKGQVKAAA